MTTKDQQELKKLIKEGTIDALKSQDGQSAIVSAIDSKNGQEAIKQGALAALKSEEGKDILIDNFVQGFHEAVVPILAEHSERIRRVERKVGIAVI